MGRHGTHWTGRAIAPWLLGMFVAASSAPGGDGRANRPDVLFIVVDDLNTWIGPLGGHAQARTPHLDDLVSEAVLFTNAHCPAPASNASRAAVMTGIPPHVSGVYGDQRVFVEAFSRAVTIPEHFQHNGYRTARAGRIFHEEIDGISIWDEAFDPIRAAAPPHLSPVHAPDMPAFDWGAVEVREGNTRDARVVSWAVERLARPRAGPLFLAVGLEGTGPPWHVPAARLDRLALDEVLRPDVEEDDLEDVPGNLRGITVRTALHAEMIAQQQWERAIQAYLAATTMVDRQIGRLLRALAESDRAENTVVVLWGDNGIHLGEKQHWGGGTLWEPATHVPLIVQSPSHRRGARVDAAVSLMDLYSTLIELCVLNGRPGIGGRTLVPLLDDPGQGRAAPALTTAGRANHALRSERWRYVRYRNGREELYDHLSDPGEWTNLARVPGHEGAIASMARWLPRSDAKDVPVARDAVRAPKKPAGGSSDKPRKKSAKRGQGSTDG